MVRPRGLDRTPHNSWVISINSGDVDIVGIDWILQALDETKGPTARSRGGLQDLGNASGRVQAAELDRQQFAK